MWLASRKQLAKFLDFESDAPNKAELVNNYDWMKDFTFLDFAREVGKHITVNYMMAKDSVQKRLNGEARDGLSFTEFTYQLLQGYDFLHLYETKGCKLQMGGSDQWGNITTGAELIRRTNGGEVFALTCPLITKADGGKFGKTESGNIWLDPRYTSPYKFYQFWLNVSDEDAARYIKIFTSLSQEEVEALTAEHAEAPHLRVLQKRLAKEVTVMVHSEEDYNAAVEASGILFGNATSEALKKLDEDTLLAVFEGVPQFEVSRDALAEGVKAVDLFVDNAAVFASKGEMRKLVQGGGVSLNKEKLSAFDQVITTADLLDEKIPAGSARKEELLSGDCQIRKKRTSFINKKGIFSKCPYKQKPEEENLLFLLPVLFVSFLSSYFPSISFNSSSTAAFNCVSSPFTTVSGELATLISGSNCEFSR